MDILCSGFNLSGNSSEIAWWENDGNQSFTKHTIEGNLAEAYCVVFADMDNDLDYDLVAIGKGSNKINWYENNLTTLSVNNSVKIKNLKFKLFQNYPNPFNPSTKIKYDLTMTTNVILKIYNHLGHEIKTLINGIQTPGTKSVIWDVTNDFGEPVSSGVYIYGIVIHSDKFQTNKPFKNIKHRKMIFIK